MKVKVLREDGSVETLTLSGNMICVNGSLLNQIQDPNLDHYFTPDGYYDGWGRGVGRSEDAGKIRESVESARDVCKADDPIMA